MLSPRLQRFSLGALISARGFTTSLLNTSTYRNLATTLLENWKTIFFYTPPVLSPPGTIQNFTIFCARKLEWWGQNGENSLMMSSVALARDECDGQTDKRKYGCLQNCHNKHHALHYAAE